MPISEDYLHDMSEVQEYLVNHVRNDDVLISTVYGLYATWEAKPTFSASYRITSQTPKEEIVGIVGRHASGWIVMDQIRVDISPLSVREITNVGKIEYIGLFGDEHVWRWKSSPAHADAAEPAD